MDGSTLCSLTADLRDEAEDDAGQSPGPQGGLRDRLGTKAPKPPAATSRENAPSELIFSSPARPSSFLQSLSSPPLPILAMSSALRAAVQQVCQQPHTPPTTPLTPLPSPQSRPPPSRVPPAMLPPRPRLPLSRSVLQSSFLPRSRMYAPPSSFLLALPLLTRPFRWQ